MDTIWIGGQSTALETVSALSAASGEIDSFGRLRVSSPTPLFDSKLLHDAQPLLWSDEDIGGGLATSTYNANQASVTIATKGGGASRRIRQTFRRFGYQPDRGHAITMTGYCSATTLGSGQSARWGYFDNSNGVFFSVTSSGFAVNLRTNVTGTPETTTWTRSSFNMDKLDGTGPSGINLDVSKSNIYQIDLQYLGVGLIRFAVAHPSTGALVYFHFIQNANLRQMVYMSTPNLPLRYEVQDTGSGSAFSLTAICSAVSSEGGSSSFGTPRTVDMGTTGLQTGNDANIYPLIAIKLQSTKIDAVCELTRVNITCTTTAAYRWVLLLNPTITGTALSYSAVAHSGLERALGTNATTLSAGTILASGYAQSANEGTLEQAVAGIQPGASASGVADVVALGVSRLSTSAETFYGSLSWRE